MRSAIIAAVACTFLVPGLPAEGQDFSRQIDQIFHEFDRADSPGCALGVIRDGKFVYRKSYGSASLELGVPLTSHSVFYVGSISKQFTATSVILASEQGLLSLDDDIHKYIPELPDYGHAITLRQMLHQTSGFRDFFDLVYFSGYDVAAFNSPAAILKLVERQRELNNVPGDEWIYSNTNYFLLGIVVERASGKSLAEFAADHIFRPLGMTHTRYYDDATAVIPDRVAAYDPGPGGGFRVDWSTTYAVVGGGGLMTTVDDLLQWDNNFYANQLGKGTLIHELETVGVLNDGKRTDYGMGLYSGSYRGLPILEHDGALFGYRSDILRFPNQRFTVACLCNLSSANPRDKAQRIADLYLNDALQPAVERDSAGKNFPDPAPYAGQYLDPRTHVIDSFTAEQGNLMIWGSALRRKNANQFYDLFGDVITFDSSTGIVNASLDMNGKIYFSGRKFGEYQVDETALESFVGEYRNPELDGSLRLSVDRGALIFKSGSNPPLKLVPVAADAFAAEGAFLILFHRDGKGRISGLSVFSPSARGIEFDRAS
jgi:CubicO group peptidase (beta-lactamase class C family)